MAPAHLKFLQPQSYLLTSFQKRLDVSNAFKYGLWLSEHILFVLSD